MLLNLADPIFHLQEMRIQLEFGRLTNLSVAAIYGLLECLEMACKAM